MKFVFSGFLLYLICYFNITENQSDIHSFRKAKSDIFIIYDSDSGYISSRQAAKLFLKLSDTIKITPEEFADNDTVGKYYKTITGNYLSCAINIMDGYGDSHFLFENSPDGSLIKSEHFEGGRYSCCWDNNYEGFKKHGEYLSLKTCGTGPGSCSTETYFFKDLVSQDSQNSILTHMDAGWCIDFYACSLSSSIELKSDTLTAHYILKKIKMGKKRNKVKKTEKFDVRYVQEDLKWIALDSSRISDLPR